MLIEKKKNIYIYILPGVTFLLIQSLVIDMGKYTGPLSIEIYNYLWRLLEIGFMMALWGNFSTYP